MKKDIWKYFDKWYIITLLDSDTTDIERNLKRARVTNYEILRYKPAAKRENVPKNVSFLNLLLHNDIDETSINITQNHIKTIEKAYKNNYKNVVILEDDARFELPLDTKKISKVCNWLSKNKWEFFFFGHCPWPLPFSILKNRDIVQPKYALLSHCQALTRKGMRKVMKTYYNMKEYVYSDNLYKISSLKQYAIFPSISYQNKPPAIYKELSKSMGLNLPYNTIFYSLELLAVILPIIFLFLIVYIIIRFIIKNLKRKRRD